MAGQSSALYDSSVSPLVIVFDADCGVCQASVAWLRKRDRKQRFEFIGNDVPELPSGVSREETGHTVVVLEPGLGAVRKYTRGAAVSRLLRELRGWSIAGHALRLPGIKQLANLGYDRFAKNRHRVSAALGLTACAVPTKTAR